MKKFILALSLISSFAYAGGNIETELGREKNSSGTVNQWFAVVPTWELGSGWDAGFKVETARDTTAGSNIESKIEARVRKSVDLGAGFGAGLRVGVGRDLSQEGSDFNYYMVEPRVTYDVTHSLTAVTSYRYRDAFQSGHSFLTNTEKVGFDYKLTKLDEVGIRYAKKVGGDQQSNAWELTYVRGF